MKYLLHDKELGDIAVTANARSRRFVFRYSGGHLACTAPRPCSREALLQAVSQLRPRLKELLEKGKEREDAGRFTPQSRIDTPTLRLHLVQADVPVALYRTCGPDITFLYNAPEVLARDDVQDWMGRTLKAYARLRVRQTLVPRLLRMAGERGISVGSVRVTSARGRWGSCNSKGSISLSLYLARLPQHLQDYVLHHELTHRMEMNHSPRFWALLDAACGGDAHAMRQELRLYDTSFASRQQ